MLELIKLLQTSGKSIHSDFRTWYSEMSAASAWNIISDYCIGDHNKQNDVFSFAILLNHDTLANISRYIAAVAPKDIKRTRRPSAGLISYLNSPVAFSVSFLVTRQSQLLRNYVRMEALSPFLAEIMDLIRIRKMEEPDNENYYNGLISRVEKIYTECKRKQKPERLLRQIMLVAAFAAFVMDLVDINKSPLAIRWITDQDAMFDRHEGVAFDIGWLFFQHLRRQRQGLVDLRRPEIYFAGPGMDGKTDYAELIRLPDLLAGTLADIKLPHLVFSHAKFPPIFNNVLVQSSNNAVLYVTGTADGITTKRIAFE